MSLGIWEGFLFSAVVGCYENEMKGMKSSKLDFFESLAVSCQRRNIWNVKICYKVRTYEVDLSNAEISQT